MAPSNHHQSRRSNLNTDWYWDTIQKPNGQYKLGWTAHYEGAAKHRAGMSTKTRIREIRSRWTATGDLHVPPDPKYNKDPTPHEIRAQVARRREGGKGDVEFLPESVTGPVESALELEGGHVEEVAGEERPCDATWERERYEVSLLDLPRGRVHRKGKKSTMSVLDDDFEWIGRNQGGGCDDGWELETVGGCGVWGETGGFGDEDRWEELYGGDERSEKDGREQAVRATAMTYERLLWTAQIYKTVPCVLHRRDPPQDREHSIRFLPLHIYVDYLHTFEHEIFFTVSRS